MSVFEVAFLDALGKLTDLPVHAFLGGKIRERVDFAAYLFWRFQDHGSPDLPVDAWGAALDVPGIVAQAEHFVQSTASDPSNSKAATTHRTWKQKP